MGTGGRDDIEKFARHIFSYQKDTVEISKVILLIFTFTTYFFLTIDFLNNILRE